MPVHTRSPQSCLRPSADSPKHPPQSARATLVSGWSGTGTTGPGQFGHWPFTIGGHTGKFQLRSHRTPLASMVGTESLQSQSETDLVAYPTGFKWILGDPINLIWFAAGHLWGGSGLGFNLVHCANLAIAGVAAVWLAREILDDDGPPSALVLVSAMSLPALSGGLLTGMTEAQTVGWAGLSPSRPLPCDSYRTSSRQRPRRTAVRYHRLGGPLSIDPCRHIGATDCGIGVLDTSPIDFAQSSQSESNRSQWHLDCLSCHRSHPPRSRRRSTRLSRPQQRNIGRPRPRRKPQSGRRSPPTNHSN